MRRDDENPSRTLALLQAFAVSRAGLFILPVIVPYYEQHIGLTFQQFLWGEAAFGAVIVASELPSGWLADVWQRRMVLALGGALQAASYGLLWAADGFWSAFVAQALIGLGVAMVSGADQALLYDHLAAQRRAHDFRRLQGRLHALGLYSLAAASLAGALLYALSPHLVFAATVAATAGAGLFAFFLSEPPRAKRARAASAARDLLQSVTAALRRDPAIWRLILFAGIFFALTLSGHWTQQPYYLALRIDEVWFGPLAAGYLLLGGLAGQFGHLLDRRFGALNVLTLLVPLLALAYAAAAWAPGWAGVFLLYGGALAFGFAQPALAGIVNRRIGAERRATLLSLVSFAVRAAFIPLSAVMGWLAAANGIASALLFLACFLVLGGGAAVLALRAGLAGEMRRFENDGAAAAAD